MSNSILLHRYHERVAWERDLVVHATVKRAGAARHRTWVRYAPIRDFYLKERMILFVRHRMAYHTLCPPETDIVFTPLAKPYRQILSVTEYWFDDIRQDDRVLDIGANIGGFCIRAAKKSGHVNAVEPVTTHPLRENIRANNGYVQVIEGALGDGKPAEICWDECRVLTRTYPIRDLIRMSGGCDFLKCDCEGAEWLINPPELNNIRRIEMEIHLPPISGPPNPDLLAFISHRYNFVIERKPCHDILGVMGILHAERR